VDRPCPGPDVDDIAGDVDNVVEEAKDESEGTGLRAACGGVDVNPATVALMTAPSPL